VGARSWLRCDWSIYILGRGLAKGEFGFQEIVLTRTTPLNALKKLPSDWLI